MKINPEFYPASCDYIYKASAILAKDTKQHKQEETKTNVNGDVVKTGTKTGEDPAIITRCDGAPNAAREHYKLYANME